MFRPSRAEGALLLVAFSVLASTATVYAECAWVLWLQRGNSWGIVKAFSGLAECEALNDRLDSAIRAENKGRSTYVCLPDSVDSRGPKTK